MVEYRTVDKKDWGHGSWQDEPDKVSWTDEATGLPCLIVRSHSTGALCGYVGVGPEHPFYGSDGDGNLDVHGDITYGAGCTHGDQATSICHIPETGQSDDTWWLGFDCGHAWDLTPGLSPFFQNPSRSGVYRDIGYVKAEIARLAKQIKEKANG